MCIVSVARQTSNQNKNKYNQNRIKPYHQQNSLEYVYNNAIYKKGSKPAAFFASPMPVEQGLA